MPKTSFGKWSVGLIVLFFLLFVLFLLLVVSGQRGPGFNPILAFVIIPAGICGVSAFSAGIISIWRHKERSISIFIATAIGLLVLSFVLGEFLVPH